MSNERIMIIGCAGSGKTTLSKRLAEVTGLPLTHLDNLYWRPGWVHVTAEELDAQLMEVLAQNRWILDGNFNRTIEKRLEYCDTVIFLDLPRRTCLASVLWRVVTNLGRTRPDMGTGCPEKIDWEFIKLVWGFNRSNRSRYYELLNAIADKEVIILHSRRECKKLIADFQEKF